MRAVEHFGDPRAIEPGAPGAEGIATALRQRVDVPAREARAVYTERRAVHRQSPRARVLHHAHLRRASACGVIRCAEADAATAVNTSARTPEVTRMD